jgi:transcriptional regulator with XRE-family HTH domain
MHTNNPARFIRLHVFGFATQAEFAQALGYEQATISRFERGMPFSSEAQKRIRELAQRRGIKWDNNWFFEAPATAATPEPQVAA